MQPWEEEDPASPLSCNSFKNVLMETCNTPQILLTEKVRHFGSLLTFDCTELVKRYSYISNTYMFLYWMVMISNVQPTLYLHTWDKKLNENWQSLDMNLYCCYLKNCFPIQVNKKHNSYVYSNTSRVYVLYKLPPWSDTECL